MKERATQKPIRQKGNIFVRKEFIVKFIRNKDKFLEAINSIKHVLVDDAYWSKAYASRSVNCLFNFLDVDDGSLRLQADQCLNAIFRVSLLLIFLIWFDWFRNVS